MVIPLVGESKIFDFQGVGSFGETGPIGPCQPVGFEVGLLTPI